MDIPEQKVAALSFLKKHDLGVLATSTPEDGPSARPLYYAADDDFNLYFLTLKSTRKVADLVKTGRAAFTVYDPATPASLEMQGIVADRTDTTVIDPIVTDLARTIAAKGDHFAPLTRLDASEARFFKFTPVWIRYADFSKGTGNDQVYEEFTPS